MAEVTERPAAEIGQGKKKKKRDMKKIKRIIAIVVAVAIIGGIAYGLYSLFHEDKGEMQAMTGAVSIGSIESTVTGSGVAMPASSETITLSGRGVVAEVYVSDGDHVEAGDPLYAINSEEAQKAVDDAKESLDNYQEQLDAIYESYADLTVTAPFNGKLLEVADIKVGDDYSGGKIATIVDDTAMKLELYFSYAYESDITTGMSVDVSVPATMEVIKGTVQEVNYVDRISSEGSRLFSVVISIDNPGTLSADMGATATMTASTGETIYPYEAGKLAYSRTADVIAKTGGEVTAVNLMNYMDVTAGQVLLQMTGDDNDDRVASLENSIAEAQKNLDDAEKDLANFNAVAGMSGTVQSCTLTPGEEVESGRVAITIADTSVMTVEARIDSTSVSNVKPGMNCDIIQWGRDGEMHYTGTVESVSLEGKYENGYSYFPAVIKVDNPEGTMMSGMTVDYSMLAAQSTDCLIVPVQSVRYAIDGSAYLFVQSDMAGSDTLTADQIGIEIPEGFTPVPVTVGLTDTYNAEIVSGVNEGDVIFTQYISSSGDSYSNMGGGMVVAVG